MPIVPEVAERCSQFWLAASTLACQITDCEHCPEVFNISDCPGGFGCNGVAAKARLAGVTCSAHVCGAGVPVGVGVPDPGTGVAVPVGPVGPVGAGDGVTPGAGVFVVPAGGVFDRTAVPCGGKLPCWFPIGVVVGERTVTRIASIWERISVRKYIQVL